MGEPEQLIAEPDEVDEEVEGLHPPTLEQQNPRFIAYPLMKVVSFVTSNGWYVVGVLVVSYLAWLRFSPKIKSWLRKREEDREAAEYLQNPASLLAKHRAIDEARRRMQEQYNVAAAKNLEKQKEMEEKKRLEKIEEYERLQSGRGQTIRSSVASASSTTTTTAATKRKTPAKATLRPEYNPMTGDVGGGSSSSRWRPSVQRPSGGG